MIQKVLALAVFICCATAQAGPDASQCVPVDEVNQELARLSAVIAQLTMENDLLRNRKYKQWFSKQAAKMEVAKFLKEEGDLRSLIFLQQHEAERSKKYLK